MGRPFSEHVASDGWRREAEEWIGEQLARHGRTLSGDITQPRIRPWSTQLVVPTGAGTLWFKANCPSMAFEPRLHSELARLVPDAVDAPFAFDADRGWIVTADRGTTLGDSHEPTADDWRLLLAETARIQLLLADHRGELMAAGLPDCSPITVPERFDRIVDTFAALPPDHPSCVSPDLEIELRAKRDAITEAAQLLAESALPSTWQHGDLHPWNVFAPKDAGLRIFDFGDGQWSHAIEVLSVPYGWVTERTELAWSDLVGSYAEAWGLRVSELNDQWEASALTQPVNRSLTWWACLAGATAAEWSEWGDAPLYHLKRVLEP
ncbi:MAG: phosphotransferase [Aeromicrobium sp.]